MHWSVKLFLIFIVISTVYFLFFYHPTSSKTCVESCPKSDIQCQRDCEIEGNPANDVSMQSGGIIYLVKHLNWFKIRAEWFVGGCFVGLLIYPPFLALLSFFVPNFKVDGTQLFIKWIVSCGTICTLVTLQNKSPTEHYGKQSHHLRTRLNKTIGSKRIKVCFDHL